MLAGSLIMEVVTSKLTARLGMEGGEAGSTVRMEGTGSVLFQPSCTHTAALHGRRKPPHFHASCCPHPSSSGSFSAAEQHSELCFQAGKAEGSSSSPPSLTHTRILGCTTASPPIADVPPSPAACCRSAALFIHSVTFAGI